MSGRRLATVAEHSDEGLSRDDRKARTRRSLLDAALDLTGRDRSFSSLSLREITKEAGLVPAAFYRHFESTEELGLSLVEESFATIHHTMREVREVPVPTRELIPLSVDAFLGYVLDHETHIRFVLNERYGGSAVLRKAIRHEIRLFTSELATDLARAPKLRHLTTSDLQLLAGLVVQTVIAATELTLDTRRDDVGAHGRIRDDAQAQLLVVFLGGEVWPGTDRSALPAEPGESASRRSRGGRHPDA
jgi:AcrR family transcriptional regulator